MSERGERKEHPRELLIEELAGAWRPYDPRELRSHPAFYDLDAEGRAEAYERSIALREAEAAMDPEGRSTTAKAILARIRGERS